MISPSLHMLKGLNKYYENGIGHTAMEKKIEIEIVSNYFLIANQGELITEN